MNNSEAIAKIKEILGFKTKTTNSLRFLEVDGQLRFFTVFSNCFKDYHSEIISTEAHQEYVDWVNKSQKYPQLWLWHAGPKSKWGQVDFVDFVDGFVVASGLVDKGKEYIATALQKEDVKVSHGFYGILTKDKTFIRYRTFEVSPLPAKMAANSWTNFTFQGGMEMPFADDRKKWLKDVGKYTDDQLNELESSLAQLGENLKAAGLEWKGNDADEVIGITKSISDALTLVTAIKTKQDELSVEIEALKGKLAEFDTKVTEATKSLEQKVADAFKPQITPEGVGFKASESKSTVVEGEKQKQDLSWFNEIAESILR